LEIGKTDRAISVMDLKQFKTWADRQPRSSNAILAWADSRRWWLWGFVLVCYLAAFNGQWRMQPDAALYLSIGRNVAEGHGYTYLGRENTVAYPGWPTLIALPFKLAGSHALLAVNILITLIALLTVVMTYRLFLIHSGRPTAVVIAVGVALTKAFFCYGFELWSDMPFALGVMAFLAGYEGAVEKPDRPIAVFRPKIRKITDWSLLLCGLVASISIRPTGWPLLVAVVVALVADAIRGRIRWTMLAILSGVVALLASGFILASSRSSHGIGDVYTRFVLSRFTSNSLSGLASAVMVNTQSLLTWAASDVLFQVRLGPYFNALLSIVVVVLGFGLFRYRLLWGLWFCLLLGTILISQETLDRYFLPVLPLLVFAWWKAIARINRIGPIPWANTVFLGLFGFGALMNLTKVCGIIAQQHERPFLIYYDKGTFAAIPEFASRLSETVPANAIVFGRAPYTHVIAFLSLRAVTSPFEDPLRRAGNRPIYIMEPVDEPGKTPMRARLESAGLREGPALFIVKPRPGTQVPQPVLSLHGTIRIAKMPH
jgi:hypothetical protein